MTKTTEPDTVAVVMTQSLLHNPGGRVQRELGKGQRVELPRAEAARFWLLNWAEPADGAAFTLAERLAAGAQALAYLEEVRRARGGDPSVWWRIPAHARALDRLDVLTRPDAGPLEAA